jgi:hypothetical protein
MVEVVIDVKPLAGKGKVADSAKESNTEDKEHAPNRS